MDTLAFDGRMGASGDMLLGAMVAAGADPDVLAPVEAALPVRYDVRETTRAGVAATAVDVLRVGGEEPAATVDGDHAAGAGRGHDHADDSGHDHAEGTGPSRTLAEVLAVVDGMDLPDAAAAATRETVERLAAAEAAVHGEDPETVVFHEVGADDAVADIVGVCLLVADLDPDRVVTTPVAVGGGTVETGHGSYPVPVPAVVELVEAADWSVRGGPVEAELLTPTGAALLATHAEGVESLPSLQVRASGYGAGTKSFPRHPNVLRALRGEGAGGLRRESVTVLETTLDDATPEILGSLQESLAEAGARDVSVVPTTMKKSRPGHLVKVVVAPEDAARVAHRLALETGTLGVREHGTGHRWVADRSIEAVTLAVGGREFDVRVKIARDRSGDVFDVSAEYDDVESVAAETGRPVRELARRAEALVYDRLAAE
jgi:hypothetical protein